MTRREIARYWPVRGGESFSSRAKCVRTAVRVPPDEVPPTTKPSDGSAPKDFAFAAAHLSISHALLGAAGNRCLGPSWYAALIHTAPSA